MKSNIQEIFFHFFSEYKSMTGKQSLTYVITSTLRKGDRTSNPHAIPGNAMDFTLRSGGAFSSILEYNELFAYMMDRWPFRAGIDNTWINEPVGNVHVHIDLGENRPAGQSMPFFFKENHGRFLRQIISKDEIK